LNWIDIAIPVLLVWFTFAALRAGLIREVVTILGAVLAIGLAGQFYTELAKDVAVAVDDEQTARTIAFAMIFGAVVLASQLLALFLKQVAAMLFLGPMDSLGGAAFGFFKGAIFVEIGLIAAITFPDLGLTDTVQESALAPIFLDVLPFLKVILPAEFRNAIDSF
jgi:uncharacterized membrane protein required for colicin V production